MKKVLGIISLLLSTTLATANSIDFDKAFKESAKIENKSRKHLSQNRRISLRTSVPNPTPRMLPAMRQSTRLS